MEKKMTTPIEILCKGLPSEISTMLNYIRMLQFHEKPDYRYIRKILRELFFRKNYDWDYFYDWTIPRDKAKILEYTTKYMQVNINYSNMEKSVE